MANICRFDCYQRHQTYYQILKGFRLDDMLHSFCQTNIMASNTAGITSSQANLDHIIGITPFRMML